MSDRNFVPANRSSEKREYDLTAYTPPVASISVDSGYQSHEGATERTSGMDRSWALVVRMMPFTVVWLVLAVGLSWGIDMGKAFTFVLFAGLTSVTYAYLDRQERQFSRNGLERHKVNKLTQLKMAEMKHSQELRKMALQAHLKMLGVDSDDD